MACTDSIHRSMRPRPRRSGWRDPGGSLRVWSRHRGGSRLRYKRQRSGKRSRTRKPRCSPSRESRSVSNRRPSVLDLSPVAVRRRQLKVFLASAGLAPAEMVRRLESVFPPYADAIRCSTDAPLVVLEEVLGVAVKNGLKGKRGEVRKGFLAGVDEYRKHVLLPAAKRLRTKARRVDFADMLLEFMQITREVCDELEAEVN